MPRGVFSLWTEELYNERLTQQGGTCAICGGLCNARGRLARDLDHVTGEARGLLCMKCYTGIGKFGGSIELLESAIVYLKGYRR